MRWLVSQWVIIKMVLLSNTIFSFKTSFAEFNISLNCGAAKVKRGAGDSFAFITTIVQQKEP